MLKQAEIKVLYFDDSAQTMSAFIKLCGTKGVIDIVGAFHSFVEMAPLLMERGCAMINALKPDALVIKVTDNNAALRSALQLIRKSIPIKLIGILCGKCAFDANLINSFDYHISSADKNCLITDENIRFRLLYQIKSARLTLNTEKHGVSGKWAVLPLPPKSEAQKYRQYKMIAIGASAGGTGAVTEVLSHLPSDMPPILLVQHLPENFSDFFAKNLDSKIPLNARVARGGEMLEAGNVYIAGYDKHLEIVQGEDGAFYTKCTFADKVSGHRPSVDVLFSSVAKAAGAFAIGVILTGMGNDGAQGLLEMHEFGAYTIGQDKESCIVYGMPMVAFSLGAVTKQLPLKEISKAIVNAVTHDETEEKAK